MTVDISLNKEVTEALGVTKTIETFEGGQKYVFIVDCKYGRCALKAFRGCSKRDFRELDFYIKNKESTGIPRVLDIYETPKDFIVIEEYIDGFTPYPIPKNAQKYKIIKELVANIASILEPFWKQKIVHRDIKPDNIIIQNHTGFPVVIDFGIAHNPDLTTLTETTFQPKSAQFASPEQLYDKKDQISYRSDFFSIAILAYFLNYGSLPFGNSQEEILETFKSKGPSCHLDAGDQLNNFFLTTFHIDPSARPRNVKKLIGAL
ncbi:protein kinase domain-containing protein [Maridesulfovibrio sp.]|uniref:protein kinase domain-containing protein n=1 Tax=Maridesulfovibrio sp. TaxID=2795000 RepID=UPI003B00C7F8